MAFKDDALFHLDVSALSESARELLQAFGDKLKPEVCEAMNRSAAGAKTDAVKLIVRKYGISKDRAETYTRARKKVQAWTIVKAWPAHAEPYAFAIARSAPVGRFRFEPSHEDPKMRPPTGVSFRNQGSRIALRHGFVAKMKSGHTGIWLRAHGPKQPGKQLPILEVFGPSLAQMADDDDIAQQVQEGMEKRFSKRFDQQVDRLLKEHG